jgi:hypothetical protein
MEKIAQMNATITIKDLMMFLLGSGGVVLIIFLIVMVGNAIRTLKSMTRVLQDVEVISAIAAERTKDLDGVIENVAESVSTVASNLKGKNGLLSTISSVISLLTSLKGFAARKKTAADTTETTK